MQALLQGLVWLANGLVSGKNRIVNAVAGFVAGVVSTKISERYSDSGEPNLNDGPIVREFELDKATKKRLDSLRKGHPTASKENLLNAAKNNMPIYGARTTDTDSKPNKPQRS